MPPVETNYRVSGHEDHGRWRGDLLGDAEQQSQHAETADVQSTPRERGEDASYEAHDQQHRDLPPVNLGDRTEGPSLVVAVQEQ